MAKQVEIDTRGLDNIEEMLGEGRALRRWIIKDGVEYGIYVEFGTTKQKAQPALVPAFEKHTKALPVMVAEIIDLAASQGAGTRKINDLLRILAFNIQVEWQMNVPVDTGALKNSIKAEEE